MLTLASRDPASDTVDFPLRREIDNVASGKPIQKIRMVILKARDKIESKRQAGKLIREQFRSDFGRVPTADDLNAFDVQRQFDDLLACEILQRCCRNVKRANSEGPAVYPAIFASADWLRDNLTSEELGVLFRLYIQTELTCGASEQVLDDDPATLKIWVDRLKKGLWSVSPFSRLDSASLEELLLSFAKMADRLESYGLPILDPQFLSLLSSLTSSPLTLPEDISSSGEPQESSTPTTISAAEALRLARELRSRPQ